MHRYKALLIRNKLLMPYALVMADWVKNSHGIRFAIIHHIIAIIIIVFLLLLLLYTIGILSSSSSSGGGRWLLCDMLITNM